MARGRAVGRCPCRWPRPRPPFRCVRGHDTVAQSRSAAGCARRPRWLGYAEARRLAAGLGTSATDMGLRSRRRGCSCGGLHPDERRVSGALGDAISVPEGARDNSRAPRGRACRHVAPRRRSITGSRRAKWPNERGSVSTFWRSARPPPTRRGSEGPSRTSTASSASTSRREPTWTRCGGVSEKGRRLTERRARSPGDAPRWREGPAGSRGASSLRHRSGHLRHRLGLRVGTRTRTRVRDHLSQYPASQATHRAVPTTRSTSSSSSLSTFGMQPLPR